MASDAPVEALLDTLVTTAQAILHALGRNADAKEEAFEEIMDLAIQLGGGLEVMQNALERGDSDFDKKQMEKMIKTAWGEKATKARIQLGSPTTDVDPITVLTAMQSLSGSGALEAFIDCPRKKSQMYGAAADLMGMCTAPSLTSTLVQRTAHDSPDNPGDEEPSALDTPPSIPDKITRRCQELRVYKDPTKVRMDEIQALMIKRPSEAQWVAISSGTGHGLKQKMKFDLKNKAPEEILDHTYMLRLPDHDNPCILRLVSFDGSTDLNKWKFDVALDDETRRPEFRFRIHTKIWEGAIPQTAEGLQDDFLWETATGCWGIDVNSTVEGYMKYNLALAQRKERCRMIAVEHKLEINIFENVIAPADINSTLSCRPKGRFTTSANASIGEAPHYSNAGNGGSGGGGGGDGDAGARGGGGPKPKSTPRGPSKRGPSTHRNSSDDDDDNDDAHPGASTVVAPARKRQRGQPFPRSQAASTQPVSTSASPSRAPIRTTTSGMMAGRTMHTGTTAPSMAASAAVQRANNTVRTGTNTANAGLGHRAQMASQAFPRANVYNPSGTTIATVHNMNRPGIGRGSSFNGRGRQTGDERHVYRDTYH